MRKILGYGFMKGEDGQDWVNRSVAANAVTQPIDTREADYIIIKFRADTALTLTIEAALVSAAAFGTFDTITVASGEDYFIIIRRPPRLIRLKVDTAATVSAEYMLVSEEWPPAVRVD